MRIAITGLGGVGGYFGGKLAKKYAATREHDVIFVARGEHLTAIKNNGLKLITTEGEFRVKPTTATDKPLEIGLLDIIVFCVKSYDLEDSARMIFNNLHESTIILPLLNGVDVSDRLKSVLPKGIVLNGCVYISSNIVRPGVVRQIGGSCQLVFGPDNNADVGRFRYIEDILREAGIKAKLVKDVAITVWTKYVFVSPLAGLTSMLGKTFGAILEDQKSREMLEGMIKETELIAREKGINLPKNIAQVSLEKTASFPYLTKSSMQLDYEKGRKTEIEIFTGYIVKAGKELGVKTPLHNKVYDELLKRT